MGEEVEGDLDWRLSEGVKKIIVFTCNEHKWKPYTGDEVKAWVGVNLQRRINEKSE